jgi:hypothetical protein
MRLVYYAYPHDHVKEGENGKTVHFEGDEADEENHV